MRMLRLQALRLRSMFTRSALRGINEQVNMNRVWRMQYIMFCGLGGESCSPVHYGRFRAVFCKFWRFLVIYFTMNHPYIYEEVKNNEQPGDSMRQFALSEVNK
jgi:hypothetical protein